MQFTAKQTSKASDSQIIKVVVLDGPYFPLQRLQIRFSGKIL